jgi:UDP-N-acetylmuramoyl-tripeptide--D-alanyl-D-alanine ligase
MIKVVMFKSFIQRKLESYVRAYLSTHLDIKVVMVTGSVGKTSTKIAIATVLAEKFRVRLHEGNHNAELSAPLAILGIEYPDSIRNIGAWLAVFSAARQRIRNPSDVDIIIQEIGSDRIGQVPHAGTYITPDIAVITAVSPEHMEYFGTIEEVAKEELAAANFAKQALINRDDIDGRFATYLTSKNISTYGSSAAAEYYFVDSDFTVNDGYTGTFVAKEWDDPVPATIRVLGEHSTRPAIAAAAVAVALGLSASQVSAGLSRIRAVNGRMNVLRGIKNTMLIDDTYNSSPLAASSALKALYGVNVPQKIAILGSMNELGESSAAEHTALGTLCDPNQLAWVITVGDQAQRYIAPAAKANGCQVKSFKTALQAGAFLHTVIESHAALLFKGSEGKIYLEEAVKMVLHTSADEHYLVRQSAAWQKQKTAFFSSNQ